MLTSAKLDAKSHRRVTNLANYNIGICYKSRKTNMDENALFRIPWSMTLEHDSVQAIIKVSC